MGLGGFGLSCNVLYGILRSTLMYSKDLLLFSITLPYTVLCSAVLCLCCRMTGLLLSLILTEPEDVLMYEKMVAPVTKQEQKFMEAFGIDDGDGCVDYKEYVILMAVRMGSVPPQLVKEIQDRFHMLDRKRCGEILYSDLILPPKRLTRKERIQNFVGSAKSLGDSFGDSLKGSISRAGSFNESIKDSLSRAGSFNRGRTTDPASLVAVSSLSPSNSGKVMPFNGSEGDGNIIISPGNISRPTSQVTPLGSPGAWKEEEQNKPFRNETSQGKGIHDSPLRCSESIEALDMLDLSSEKSATSKKVESKGHDGDDICSLESFNEDEMNNVYEKNIDNDDIKMMKMEKKMKGSQDSDVKQVEEDEDDSFEIKDSSNLRAPLASAFPQPQLRTFRGTMSLGSVGSESGEMNVTLTPRQKEFFDEQEKLRQAQLQIEKKNNMSSLVYFLHHQLLPHAGAIMAW